MIPHHWTQCFRIPFQSYEILQNLAMSTERTVESVGEKRQALSRNERRSVYGGGQFTLREG